MKKQMVVCFVAAAVMMLVTGCGTKEDRTTLHIKDGGKVTLTIMEGCMKLRVAGEEKTGKKGESFFIPADSGAIEVQGNGVFITVQT